MNGAVLAVDFILRSLERLGTAKKLILGQNLAILSSGEAVYFPTGQMPSKDHISKTCQDHSGQTDMPYMKPCLQDARSRRLAGLKPQLSRQHFVARKNLGVAFAERLQDPDHSCLPFASCDVWTLLLQNNFRTCPAPGLHWFLAADHPEGQGAQWARRSLSGLFAMFEASEFRKLMVDVVCKAGQGLGQKNGVEPETSPPDLPGQQHGRTSCCRSSHESGSRCTASARGGCGSPLRPQRLCRSEALLGPREQKALCNLWFGDAWCLVSRPQWIWNLYPPSKSFRNVFFFYLCFWNRPLASCTIYDLWTFTFSNVFTSYALKRRISDKLCMSKNQY